ncbi:hypothetical protein LJC22_07030 [Desulfosarcina sp. OttesenSCG-928-G10]|nr:hypothetical protein [Desulfosarcina sp. OttesenSCG-928-G10]
MKAHEFNMIKKTNDLLSLFNEKVSEKCNIMSDGAYDESIIVGTRYALISLAKKLVEIVYNSTVDKENKNNFFFERNEAGVHFLSTDSIKSVFDDMADVWPVCIFIADNDEDVRTLIKYLNRDF